MKESLLKSIEWGKIMRIGVTQLMLLLLLVGIGRAEHSSAQSELEQLVSVRLTDVSLKQAIKTLETKTSVKFVYSRNVIELDRKVSVVASQEKLSALLTRLFNPLQIRYEFLSGNIILSKVISSGKSAQRPVMLFMASLPVAFESMPERTVHGTVTSESGEVLPGVNILLKGTNRGVNTNNEGKYQISVPDNNAVLIFSFIGYESQELAVGSFSTLDVKLKSNEKALNEVVVVGYGEQKKVSFTGAESVITPKELRQTPTALLGNALGGRMSGIVTVQRSGEPGYDNANIWIRGIGTFGSNQAPLFMVDGVERDFNNIDPHEVESFTILKDASATAVFGVRGANGVVLVNTRRGASGKAKVSVTMEKGVLSPTRLPKYVDGFTYAGLYNEANQNAGLPLPYTDEVLQKIKDQSDPIRYPDVDWMKLMKPSSTQDHVNVNISGGNPTVRYFVSASYFHDRGLFVEDPRNAYKTNIDRKRYNLRTNIDINLSKDIELNIGITGIMENRNFPGTGTQTIFDLMNKATPILYPMQYPDGRIPGTVASPRENPFGRLTQTGFATEFLGTTQGTFGLKYDLGKLVKGLSARGRFAFDSYSNNNIGRRKNFETWLASADNDADGNPIYSLTAEGDKFLGYSVSSSGERRLYLEGSLNYSRSFGKHDVGGMLLYNQGDRQLTASDAIGSLPYRRVGLVGRVTYGWSDKYFAEVNFGYNGSENFPRGKRFGFFPAFSAGWVASEEPFFKNNIRFINLLKFKGSYGIVGNDQINSQRFLYLTTLTTGSGYTFGTEFNNGQSGIFESSIGNPNITWETSHKTNVGVELHALKDRLTMFVDFFKEHRTNILTQRGTVPDLLGIQSLPYANIGIVDNHGIDGTISYRTRIGGVGLELKGNYTFARNNIVFTDEPQRKFDYLRRTGQRVNQPFGLQAIGLFKDEEDVKSSPKQTFNSNVFPGDVKYKDINNDGVIDVYDETPIGFSNVPEMIYGLSTTLTYKGFDLSLLFQGVGNVTVFRNYLGYIPFFQGQFGNVLEAALDRWSTTNPNPNATFPRLYPGSNDNNYRNSTYWQIDGSYVRLKNAQIGYTFPKSIAGKIGAETVRIYANGLNLFLWDKVKHYDPESGDGAGKYPPSRVFNFGININF
ncbi:SusC/RagA family TonB-linked outer membrane protein [Siphonobacter aquaeclarae]|uniref:TonB-linked outer membrane protein, SusC/RagA family n=1 Tax=Siphonobacter aquaeclarae TaxID=563176 RepID=A0A1G9NKG0_9BACT|nr:TonB-dependent receptor [Siphonobacter aquaeclarae]MBO9637917.1 TonB-dependent receptor [Siphonobacter aquaeclarae]SDL86517.1 TonB-linked outer membrane protein, SusC/RagA family [Siphonobacter aquaeclarae]